MDDSRTSEPLTRPINRRALIGGAAGLAALTLTGAGYAAAQESTPDAAGNAADATERLDQVRALVALVGADRAAIATTVDVTTVDQLLGVANDLLNQAGSAVPADDAATEQAARLAISAGLIALGARSTLVAELSDFGLPSQQAPASRRLAATHAWLTDALDAITTPGVTDAATALQFAQDLYAASYTDYTAGRYDQAKHRDQATNQLLRAALILSGELENHRLTDSLDGAGNGRPGRFGRRRRDRRGEHPSFEEWTTPVEVPAP